jgi:uncharacterized protein
MLLEETIQLQRALADSCRTGCAPVIKGASPDRLEIYRTHVYKGIKAFLRRAYPITEDALGDLLFDQLVRDFMREHKAQSPQVTRMMGELYTYAKRVDYATRMHRPWLLDLLHFEWIEIEVHRMEDRPAPHWKEEGDLWTDPLILNPHHRLDRYSYPVFRVHPSEFDGRQGTYFLFTYRHPEVLNVRFLEVTPLQAVALLAMANEPMPLPEALSLAAEQLHMAEAKEIESFTTQLLETRAALGFGGP